MSNSDQAGGVGVGVVARPRKQRHLSRKDAALEFFVSHGWRKAIGKHLHLETIPEDYVSREIYEVVARQRFANSNKSSMRARMYDAGFLQSKADELYDVIQPLATSSFSQEQLFDICLEYTLGRFEPLTKPEVRFYKFSGRKDQWVKVPSFGHYVFNMSAEFTDAAAMLRSLPNSSSGGGGADEDALFFHATNWKTYADVLQIGILASKNRKCLDFGVTPSFFMSPAYAVTEDYASKRNRLWSDECCVLIFKVPNSVLNDRVRTKTFRGPTEEWKRLTQSSRSCQVAFNELDRYEFVFGPMVANPEQVAKLSQEPVTHTVAKFQLASKKDVSNKLLMDNFLGCVFFDKWYYSRGIRRRGAPS